MSVLADWFNQRKSKCFYICMAGSGFANWSQAHTEPRFPSFHRERDMIFFDDLTSEI